MSQPSPSDLPFLITEQKYAEIFCKPCCLLFTKTKNTDKLTQFISVFCLFLHTKNTSSNLIPSASLGRVNKDKTDTGIFVNKRMCHTVFLISLTVILTAVA